MHNLSSKYKVSKTNRETSRPSTAFECTGIHFSSTVLDGRFPVTQFDHRW